MNRTVLDTLVVEVGLDSMDALTWQSRCTRRPVWTSPERDYPQITSIATCVSYLAARSSS